jgi:hypothetical protein
MLMIGGVSCDTVWGFARQGIRYIYRLSLIDGGGL